MSNVEFTDNSIEVKNIIKETAISFLHEACGEIRSLTVRNSRRKTSQTAGSYEPPIIDEDALIGYVGSNYENAIWEEFGTGEYAKETGHQGRQGYWVYVKGGSSPASSAKGGKNYATLKEAKRAMAFLRSKGLEAYYTKGKRANRPMQRAYTASREKIIKRAEALFGGVGK